MSEDRKMEELGNNDLEDIAGGIGFLEMVYDKINTTIGGNNSSEYDDFFKYQFSKRVRREKHQTGNPDEEHK